MIDPALIDAKPIRGFPEYYVLKTGVIMRNNNLIYQDENKHGYLKVALYVNGKRYWRLVHRLVAEHFPADGSEWQNVDGLEVHHRDTNRRNNYYLNLSVWPRVDHMVEFHNWERIEWKE